MRRARIPLSSSFNWRVQDPKIRFGSGAVWGVEGSVGYSAGSARVELEIGHEKFTTTAANASDSGISATYLLAKDLAHNVVSGKTEKLGQALAETPPQDIVAFAQAVGHTNPSIDSKVCNKKVAINGTPPPELKIPEQQQSAVGRWSCVDYGSSGTLSVPVSAGTKKEGSLSNRFATLVGHDELQEDSPGQCNQKCVGSPPIIRCNTRCPRYFGYRTYYGAGREWYSGRNTNRGWPGTAKGKINTAQGMAGDLVSNLNSEEQGTVAGILTRTVSGGEVVEVQAVTTTSVIANVCYDLAQKVLVPFGCIGLGTNIVSVTDGHLDARLAYKLKAGLSYYITARTTAFISGYYHKVLGNGEYPDVPVQHLLDDQSPEGRSKNYALAKFKVAYTGAEFGVRFAF